MILNKNKIIKISIGILLIVGIGIFLNQTFNKPTKLNYFIASRFYKAPANTSFVDDNFYKCVVDHYNFYNNSSLDYTEKLTDEQLLTITSLTCNGQDKSENEKITNLIGIEKLTELKSLSLNNNNITEIDLSNNIKLESFNGENNNLSSINFGEISSLKYLYLSNNDLSMLDLSKQSNLIHFRANNNKINNVNLNNNTNLIYLSMKNNQLTELNVDSLVKLETLYISDNLIDQINLKNNNLLDDVRIQNNQLETLEIENKLNLTNLDVDNNKLLNVKISNNPILNRIGLNNNAIESLTIENNNSLNELYINQNNLITLDVSSNTALKTIHAYQNKIENININNLENLKELIIWHNNLQNINLENNINLSTLKIAHNDLETINLINNNKLTDIDLEGNSFKIIKLSNQNYELALPTIIDSKNHIELLEIENERVVQPLEELKLYINNKIVVPQKYSVQEFINKLQLKNLTAVVYDSDNNEVNDNIKNGYYLKIYDNEKVLQNLLIETFENPYFDDVNFYKCVVDSYNSSNTSAKTYDDVLSLEELKGITKIKCETENKIMSVKGIEYLENITYLYLPNNNISNIDLSNNPKLEFLNLQKNDLNSINLSNLVDLTDAWLDSNFLTEIDVSTNISLKNLSLEYNDLTEIDLSNNKILETIALVGNELTGLDLSNNENLLNVNISNNYESNIVVYKDELIDINSYNPVKFPIGKESIIQDPNIKYSEMKYENNTITINKSGIYYINVYFQPNVSGVGKLYSVNYNINVIDINSDSYLIKDNNIYIDREKNNLSILDNIKINGIIPGITKSIENNKLIIKYNSEVIKEFNLLYIDMGNLNVQQKNIVLEEEIIYEDFINNITTSEELSYKIFNNEEEITSGNVSAGMNLKIYYNEEIIDSYKISTEFLNLNNLKLDETKKLIKDLELGSKVSDLKEQISTSGTITIVNKNNKELTDEDLITTGSKVKIELTSETYEYTLSVKGDITGTGTSTVSDVAKLYQFLKNKIEMEDCYIEAGNVVGEETEIRINDVAKLYQFIKKKISSLEA